MIDATSVTGYEPVAESRRTLLASLARTSRAQKAEHKEASSFISERSATIQEYKDQYEQRMVPIGSEEELTNSSGGGFVLDLPGGRT